MRSLVDKITHFFPTPQFLTLPAVGLDISDDAVKFVELATTAKGVRLGRYGKKILENGTIVDGVIKQPADLLKVLEEMVNEYDLDFAHAALPEEHAYLFQTDIPSDTPYNRIKTTIEFSLKENVPLSPEEVIFDYDVISQTNKVITVAVTVYPRSIIESYVAVIKDSGLTLLSLETEGKANARSAVENAAQQTVMMVDIGKLGTVISIISRDQLVFATSVEVSGDDFTRAVERFLQISFAEAEQVKSEKGFIKSDENNDLFEALLGDVSTLRDGINKHMTYWHMHGGGTKKPGIEDVDQIILCGGGANLRGLRDYLRATMDVPIDVANVWTNLVDFEDYIPPMGRKESLQFATAIGLAMKNQ